MQSEPDVFSSLAAQLDPDERRDLLERISKSHPTQTEPFIAVDERVEKPVDELYESLGFFRRILIIVKSILTRRDRISVLEDVLLDRMGRRIAHDFPGVFDFRSESFGTGYENEIRKLRESLIGLSDSLKSVLENEKPQFIAFIGSLQMPWVHERLSSLCDFDHEHEVFTIDDDFELKKRAHEEMQDVLSSLSEDDRNEMYLAVRSLFFLKELVSFPFARIEHTYAKDMVSDLSDLADILYSIRFTPSKRTVSSLVLYLHRNSLSEEEERKSVERSYEKLAGGLRAIASFCSRVPLLDVLKILKRDVGYSLDELGGGEEWFNLFRKYWEDRLEHALEAYSYRIRRNELREQLRELYGNVTGKSLDNYRSAGYGDNSKIRYALCSEIVLYVAEILFERQVSRQLKLLLINGEFYKAQNREELTDTFNGLSALSGKLRSLDRTLEADNEDSDSAESQLRTGSSKRRRKVIFDHAENELEKLIRTTIDYLDSCINLMKGILRGESGERYDTLSNVSHIGGSDNARFLSQLAGHLSRCAYAKRLLHEAYDLERTYQPEPTNR